jgi:hypothetical protein
MFFSIFYNMMSEQLPKTTSQVRIISFIRNENVISVLLIIISFCVYLTTMCRSVGFTDSGELAAVVCTLGIAHPTGYTLFTLLGRLWIMIPFPVEEILRLNFFSAFLVAVAVGLFFKTSITLHRSTTLFRSKGWKYKEAKNRYFILASAIASLILGLSTTFWSQSATFEVYALHLVLVLLATWTFVGGLEEQLLESQYISRKLILFAFVLGLSFSNHMTTILLAPGFLWLYFRTFGFDKNSFLRIFKITPIFLLGLSIYLYLPIRSASNPLFDWGHPATSERLLWHISGKQFRVWMFSGWNVVQKQLSYYVNNFTSEFSFIAIICIAIGTVILWKQSRKLSILLALLLFTTILYSVNYDIFDIGSYFLLSYIVVGFVVVYGIEYLFNRIEFRRLWIRVVVITILFMLPIIQIMYHYNEADESTKELPQQFVENAFDRLEPNAVVLATQWDYFISPSLYYQFIRNRRTDITIIDKSLLQNRSWYFMQLENHVPWLIERVHPKVNEFLEELNKFEHERPFNFNVIRACWQNLITEIVEKSLPDHPVYIDARIDQEFPSIYCRIPAGFFLRLTKDEDTTCYRTALAHFAIWDKKQPVAMDFEEYYISMLIHDADWLLRHKRVLEAKTVLTEALRLEPGHFTATWLMKQTAK